MLQDFELVIFDCDGVVVDSEVLSCRCLAETLRRHGLVLDLDEVFERFLGRGFATVEEHYEHAVGKALPEAFRKDLKTCLTASFESSLQAMPHVRDVLDTLDRPYCLASSSDAERLRLTLGLTGLAAYFTGRVYHAGMVTRGKPAPDLFLHAAARMDAAAERTLVIEDSLSGVQAAKAAGMTVWGFTGGSHCVGRDAERALATAGAERVFTSMSDFMAG